MLIGPNKKRALRLRRADPVPRGSSCYRRKGGAAPVRDRRARGRRFSFSEVFLFKPRGAAVNNS